MRQPVLSDGSRLSYLIWIVSYENSELDYIVASGLRSPQSRVQGGVIADLITALRARICRSFRGEDLICRNDDDALPAQLRNSETPSASSLTALSRSLPGYDSSSRKLKDAIQCLRLHAVIRRLKEGMRCAWISRFQPFPTPPRMAA